MKRPPGVAKGESGQSSIEFAMTILLLLGFTVFFLQLSLVFAWGNYIHYATFMSARALQSGGLDPADQRQRAAQLLSRMVKRGEGSDVDRFPLVARGKAGVGGGDSGLTGAEIGEGPQFVGTVRDFSWQEGVRYTFRSKLFLLPFGGVGGAASRQTPSAGSVELTSESWLGREPSYQECVGFMTKGRWLIDNGC